MAKKVYDISSFSGRVTTDGVSRVCFTAYNSKTARGYDVEVDNYSKKDAVVVIIASCGHTVINHVVTRRNILNAFKEWVKEHFGFKFVCK